MLDGVALSLREPVADKELNTLLLSLGGMGNQRRPGLDEPLLAWLEAQLDGRMTLSTVRSLHGGESPWWVGLTASCGSRFSAILRSPSSRISPDQIATNAAALAVAEKHGLSAPRLLAADLDGRATGISVSLETVVPGTSTWPTAPSVELLQAAGAAIARVHTVVLDPQPRLPFRPRPIAVDDFARDRRAGRMSTTTLLQRADERVQAIKAPAVPVVFVHGDVWPGNTVVTAGGVRALIDWKTAGAGHPGVDLGELRKQVAIRYDPLRPQAGSHTRARAGSALIGRPSTDSLTAKIAATGKPRSHTKVQGDRRRGRLSRAARRRSARAANLL